MESTRSAVPLWGAQGAFPAAPAACDGEMRGRREAKTWKELARQEVDKAASDTSHRRRCAPSETVRAILKTSPELSGEGNTREPDVGVADRVEAFWTFREIKSGLCGRWKLWQTDTNKRRDLGSENRWRTCEQGCWRAIPPSSCLGSSVEANPTMLQGEHIW